jgi:hypothetical protein
LLLAHPSRRHPPPLLCSISSSNDTPLGSLKELLIVVSSLCVRDSARGVWIILSVCDGAKRYYKELMRVELKIIITKSGGSGLFLTLTCEFIPSLYFFIHR